MPEMTAKQHAYYLARIQDATTPTALRRTAEDARREHLTDEATRHIEEMVEAKTGRLTRGD